MGQLNQIHLKIKIGLLVQSPKVIPHLNDIGLLVFRSQLARKASSSSSLSDTCATWALPRESLVSWAHDCLSRLMSTVSIGLALERTAALVAPRIITFLVRWLVFTTGPCIILTTTGERTIGTRLLLLDLTEGNFFFLASAGGTSLLDSHLSSWWTLRIKTKHVRLLQEDD